MDKHKPIGYQPGKGNPLDKKVPKNSKYANVQSTIDTGMTVKNIEVISDKQIAKRKGEMFKRIKISTLANLLREDRNFESIYDLKGNGEEEMKQGDFEDNRSVYSAVSAQTAKTDATQVSAITYATEQLGITNQTSFLLLDLREPEDFELYHINESINYPAPNIARDRALPVFYQFKNKEDKLMIIYHNDEKNGIPSAQLFFEKGYDNIYLLSGGLEEFLQEFPELVEGKKVPVLPKKPAADKKKTILKRSNYTEDKKANGVAIANSHFKGATGNSSMMSGNDNISVSNQSVRSNNMSMRSASLKKD